MSLFARVLPLLTVLSVFAVDRVTKVLIKNNMLYGKSHPILPFFSLTYIENTGAAFGIGQSRNTFFIAASILILGILFGMVRRTLNDYPKMKAAAALIIGGALGNLYDRITQGSVTDFLDFYAGGHHWPAFNIADSSIFVGTVLLVLFQWKNKKAQAS